MSYVNDSNFETAVPPEMRDEFWRRVKFSLRGYFNESEAVADRYREAMEDASIREQLLVYHCDPLNVAADLAEVKEISKRHLEDYRTRFPYPTAQALPLPLR